MMYVLAALVGFTLMLGIWVLSLMADIYLARDTINVRDRTIRDQKAYIETILGVNHDQVVAIQSAERVTVELDRIRKELQFGRGMRVEVPQEKLDKG